MVTIWFQGEHLPEASLHAFLAGQVDPPAQAAISSHLGACAECSERLAQVQAVFGLFANMGPKEPDELTWRRIRERVRAQLESDAAPERHTLDLLLGHRWITAGLAAAIAVAVLVWFAPRPKTVRVLPTPIAELGPPVPEAQVVLTGAAPLELKLTSGAELSFGAHSQLVAEPSQGEDTRLKLAHGEIDVLLPERPEANQHFQVITPAFNAEVRSRDFSVGYRANAYSVTVREGHVELEEPRNGTRQLVREGERLEGVAGSRPVLRRENESVSPPEAAAPVSELPAANGPAGAEEIEPGAPGQPRLQEDPVTSSSEGETTVVVEEAPLDPVAKAWRTASDAYYKDRDLAKAIEQAREVVRTGGQRPEVGLARQLLCDAYIATGRPKKALEACQELLIGANQDQARGIHYTLATIYRVQLKDCKSAIAHYNKAVVFGSATLIDDETRLFRADCAIEVGDLDLAWRDVTLLQQRAGRLARRDELEALKRRLNEVVGSRPPPGSDSAP